MDDQTGLLDLAYMMPSQAQKHVTYNEMLLILDALLHIRVEDSGRNEPPADPAEGQRHGLGSAPTGSFAGQAGRIAAFQDGAWQFYQPRAGWLVWDAAQSALLVHDGDDWTDAAPDPTALPLLGINTTAGTTNRLAVSAPATLLTHEGTGHQLKINKAAPADTGSLLFQTDWSGRAELGLAGSDDFALKVSSDGAAWHTAMSAAADTGAVRIDSLGIGTSTPASELHLNSTRTTGLSPHVLVRAGKTAGQAASVAYQRASASQQMLFAFETGSSSSPDGYFGTMANREKTLVILTSSGQSTHAAVAFDRDLGFRVGSGTNIAGSGSVGAGITAAGNAYFAGSTSIGKDTPDASAQLEVASTTRGFLPPRMSTTQRDAIPSPTEGLTIYNLTDHQLQFWNGSSWTDTN